jgi:pimeloyl-ACP methyl ester carboxylesterase
VTAQSTAGIFDLGGARLEYRFVGPPPDKAATLVLLHEGLGCVGLWGDFPDRLADATSMGVLAYSRAGYGNSSPVTLPRPLTYMHDEAIEILPRVLDAAGIRRAVLVGHSDGASIAAIHLGSIKDRRVTAATLIAPHFFVEEIGIAEIEMAREAFTHGTLREKLARWHSDVDNAFWGWNGAWLDPAFRRWDIRAYLPRIEAPILVMQGRDDQYGTLAQVHTAQEQCDGPVETLILDGVRHAPHREAADRAVTAIAEFAIRSVRTHDRTQAAGNDNARRN